MVPVVGNLRDWSAKNRLSASHLQEPVDAIRAMVLAGASDANRVDLANAAVECWPGTIVTTGPNGETLSSIGAAGEQYWVQRNFIQGAAPAGKVVLQPDLVNTAYDSNTNDTFLVSNLPEIKHHSHALETGISVWVIACWDAGLTAVSGGSSGSDASQPDNQKHYLMCVGAGDPWFILTGSSTQHATYTAHPFNFVIGASFNPATSRSVAQADIGAAGSDTVYLVNAREIGQPTNDLASSSFLPLLFKGTFIGNAPDGKPTYMIDGLQWENCS